MDKKVTAAFNRLDAKINAYCDYLRNNNMSQIQAKVKKSTNK